MTGTPTDETLWAKYDYEHLEATNWSKVYAYRENNIKFADPLLKKAIQTYRQ